MEDLEVSPAWLQGLHDLNSVIAATGQPLYGNLFYDDQQPDFADRPPNAHTRPKRDRFRAAVAGRTRLLEVGVNGGHSAYLALTSTPDLEFHGVDICEHAYVRPAMARLTQAFPGRVFFYGGDCRTVLPDLAARGLRFDAFHIDGAKHLYFTDVLNSARMIAGDEAVVVVDDTQLKSVAWVWRTCERYGLIETDPAFAPIPGSFHDQNKVGRMRPIPRWKWELLFRLHARVPPVASPAVAGLRQGVSAIRERVRA
ncbi:MAG: hypothetical protein QOK20_584 [Acidimicrobiaceae bacterium]|jgi:hypothetical protein|nr:hypothetical protein [Acidimicrobiaceae bacterium]MDQ1398652.1 hypothetical protein [Acidimicrobiaceae bacterium]